jgi:molecular chaperone DnaK
MAVIGIDLGTTYCACAYYIGDGQTEMIPIDGSITMPSVASITPNGKIALGATAKRNLARNPQDTVIEVKRKMGENVKVALGQKSYSPQEISAMYLKHIVEAAEREIDEITGAVISCPAYFKDPQRQAIRQAAEIAGINLLAIINEPTAAAYSYGVSIKGEREKSLYVVYDLGGGTFDVTVVEMAGGSLKVIGTGGDPQLGGGNFDDAIVEWMWGKLLQKHAYIGEMSEERARALKLRLKLHAEEAKIRLCGPPPREEYQYQLAQVDRHDGKNVAFEEVLSMVDFDGLVGEMIRANSIKWIDRALEVPKQKFSYAEEDITDVLLVGGSTRIPLVRTVLEERFAGKGVAIRAVESGINPDEVVARGAAIYAAEMDPESLEEIQNVLVDVTGHTLSVAVFDQDRQALILHPLIPKETQIPTRASHQFASHPGADRSKIEVYQGEGKVPTDPDVTKIGEFFIMIERINQPTPLEVGLRIDGNGMLVASAKNTLTGKRAECNINYTDSAQMSPEAVAKAQASFEAEMRSVVGATANPLDDQPKERAQPADFAKPRPAPTPQAAPAPTPTPEPQASPPPGDATSRMNPIMRALYNKAIQNFAEVPAERQGELVMLVTQIEQAALANDQATLMSYYGPLNALLQGVG